MSAEGVPIAAMIDGKDRVNWRLPLPPLNGATMPEPYSRGEAPDKDRLQAAAKMVGRRGTEDEMPPGRPAFWVVWLTCA